MKAEKRFLSKNRLSRLRAQGYVAQTEEELSQLAFGIRFAYRGCTIILTSAIAVQSTALFSAMTIVAIVGIVSPNHPFDYIYNYFLRKWMNKPELPVRANQLKFACIIASIWLTIVIGLLSAGFTTAGLIMAIILVLVAALPSTIDYCIPSAIYNVLFKKKVNDAHMTIQP